MELNSEQIKKGLQCCGSNNPCGEECFGHDIKGLSECTKILAQNALALINSQEQRIGELTEENERLTRLANLRQRDLDNANDLLFKVEDENERLKADTVRKMQERLDKHFCHDPAFLGVEQRLIMDVIDQIAKEMLEGESNG